MKLHVLGINHQTAPISLRETVAFAPDALRPALVTLEALDWIGAVNDAYDAGGSGAAPGSRYLLLVDPATTPLAPLLQHLLVAREQNLQPFWEHAHLDQLHLADVLLSKKELPAQAVPALEG